MTETPTIENDLEDINESDFTINDVVCGRGTKYCNHPGNQTYHALVKYFITDYACARRKVDKTEVSKAIVDAVNNASPPGRFLTKSKGSKTFRELGNLKAREKTSQLLRETVMIGNTNHRTMYQKKKFDKAMKKRSGSTSLQKSPSQCQLSSFLSSPSPLHRKEQIDPFRLLAPSLGTIKASRISPQSVIESKMPSPIFKTTASYSCRHPSRSQTRSPVMAPPAVPNWGRQTMCEIPKVPKQAHFPRQCIVDPQRSISGSNLLPIHFTRPPMDLFQMPPKVDMNPPTQVNMNANNKNANPMTAKTVSHLRDEIASWRIRIAELETLANLHDQQQQQQQQHVEVPNQSSRRTKNLNSSMSSSSSSCSLSINSSNSHQSHTHNPYRNPLERHTHPHQHRETMTYPICKANVHNPHTQSQIYTRNNSGDAMARCFYQSAM